MTKNFKPVSNVTSVQSHCGVPQVRTIGRVESFHDSTKVRTCSVSFPWLIRFPVVTLYRTVNWRPNHGVRSTRSTSHCCPRSRLKETGATFRLHVELGWQKWVPSDGGQTRSGVTKVTVFLDIVTVSPDPKELAAKIPAIPKLLAK